MIYAILGPTCSGKSDLAEKLSLEFNVPILNFDAFQVYKEIKKGTAKPEINESNKSRYYLYDFISIKENFDVMNYQKIGRETLEKLKDKDVILVGGTGLYLKALLFDYKFQDEEKMPDNYRESETNNDLYEKLLKIDEEDALKIGRNNRKRLLRALYIYEIHGKSKTDLNENGKNKLVYKDVTFIGLNPNREMLYNLINKRVDKMFENGLEDEVDYLFSACSQLKNIKMNFNNDNQKCYEGKTNSYQTGIIYPLNLAFEGLPKAGEFIWKKGLNCDKLLNYIPVSWNRKEE